MDRIKDVDDPARAPMTTPPGVTAAFNLNLLHRINRELDGDIPRRRLPPPRDLERRAEPDRDAPRGACATSRFTVAGQRFAMRAGETIHTENSHKYGYRDARLLLLRRRLGRGRANGPTTERTVRDHARRGGAARASRP